MDYRRRTILLIAAATLLRCFAAAAVGLGNDEVYYVTYAQHLQWNYFDHPPLVGLCIKLTTAWLHLQQYELAVRSGAILCAAGCTWLLYRTAALLFSPQAGWLTALLYTASIYASLIAGTFIMPDSPQMLFWCWALLLVAKITGAEKPANHYWLLFGLAAGLCIMSKVHGVFLWTGMGMYILFFKRSLLRQRGVYLAFMITLLVISPIFIWNWQHDFITWRFHSQRVAVQQFSFNKDGFFRELLGQLLYNNPVNVSVTVAALTVLLKKNARVSAASRVYMLTGLPMIIILLVVAAFRDTLPHWSGPAWCTLLLPAAGYVAAVPQRRAARCFRAAWAGLALLVVVVLAGIVVVNYYPGSLSSSKAAETAGDGDATLDMYGWPQLAAGFDTLRRNDEAAGRMQPDAGFVCNKWFPAAHIDYYVARPLNRHVTGIGSMYNLHHYCWLNQLRDTVARGSDAWCIVPSNYAVDMQEQYLPYFAAAEKAAVIPSYRSGKITRCFTVYRLRSRR